MIQLQQNKYEQYLLYDWFLWCIFKRENTDNRAV